MGMGSGSSTRFSSQGLFMPANAEVSFQNGEAEMLALQVFAGPDPAKKYDAWIADP